MALCVPRNEIRRKVDDIGNIWPKKPRARVMSSLLDGNVHCAVSGSAKLLQNITNAPFPRTHRAIIRVCVSLTISIVVFVKVKVSHLDTGLICNWKGMIEGRIYCR